MPRRTRKGKESSELSTQLPKVPRRERSGTASSQRMQTQSESSSLRSVAKSNRGSQEQLDWRIEQIVHQRMEMAGVPRAQPRLHEFSASPLAPDISNFPLPTTFRVPNFILYDGVSDPIAHLRHVVQRLSIWGDEGRLYCKIFSSSLDELPLRWFCSLPAASISSWRQLQQAFVAQYQVHIDSPRTNADLVTLRMRRGERLAQFSKRFWTLYSQIENASDPLAILSFQQALLPDNELRGALAKDPVVTVTALMARVDQYVRREADASRTEEQFGHHDDETSNTSSAVNSVTSSSAAETPSSAETSSSLGG